MGGCTRLSGGRFTRERVSGKPLSGKLGYGIAHSGTSAGRLDRCYRLRVARRGVPLRWTYSILHHSIRFDSVRFASIAGRDKSHCSLTFGAFLPRTVCHQIGTRTERAVSGAPRAA